jgi:dethiobiotin synthetase
MEFAMHKGIFITGTDTGVGKTFVALGLIEAMKKKGLNVCPMKPVESGCRIRKGRLIPDDSIKLLKASGVGESIDLINPYRLKHPLAPSVASGLEGIRINKRKVLTAYNRLSRKYDIVIAEGAGGIMVPVYKKYLFLDLIKELDLPIIIVARPGLGTINHTLLTIEAARKNNITILGTVMNYSENFKKGLSEKTNPDVIEEVGRVPILASIPFLKKTGGNNLNIFKNLADRVLSGLSYKKITGLR